MLDTTAIVRQSQHQVSCNLDNEVAILELQAALYFGLNDVGAHIWQLLQEPRSVDGICDSVAEHYDVDPATCRTDVLRFLERMRDAGLIDVVT